MKGDYYRSCRANIFRRSLFSFGFSSVATKMCFDLEADLKQPRSSRVV